MIGSVHEGHSHGIAAERRGLLPAVRPVLGHVVDGDQERRDRIARVNLLAAHDLVHQVHRRVGDLDRALGPASLDQGVLPARDLRLDVRRPVNTVDQAVLDPRRIGRRKRAKGRRVVPAEDRDHVAVRLQQVLADAHRALQVPLRVLLGHHVEPVPLDRVQEAVRPVDHRVHRRRVKHDDVPALRQLLHQILPAHLARVVVVRTRVRRHVTHVRDLRVEVHDRNARRLQLVQRRYDPFRLRRIQEDPVDVLRHQVLDLLDLPRHVVGRVDGDQRVPVRLNLLADRLLNQHEERVGLVHAREAKLVVLLPRRGSLLRCLSPSLSEQPARKQRQNHQYTQYFLHSTLSFCTSSLSYFPVSAR